MSRQMQEQLLVASLNRAGDLVAQTTPTGPRADLFAAWQEQVAAALAAAHLDDELLVWQERCAEASSAPDQEALEQCLDLLRAWQGQEKLD